MKSPETLSSRALSLLSQTRTIRHYETVLDRAQGSHFNIFEILRVGHHEVTTHSPILAALLDPRGAHGRGGVFLQQFLDVVGITNIDVFSAKVEEEVHIGSRTETDGGRIDIVITDGNGKQVFIENKIYACEQENQLGRYQNHNPSAQIVFLSLEGGLPVATPTEKLTSLKCISYKNDIIAWLERCRKESATIPSVREIITHYIHLIQNLTNQNTNAQMNNELAKVILQDKESYIAYTTLVNVRDKIRGDIINRLNKQLGDLAKELGMEMPQSFTPRGTPYERFEFTNSVLKEQNLRIAMEAQARDYKNFCYGFKYIDDTKKSPLTEPLQSMIRRINASQWWATWAYCDQYRDWDDEVFASILTGDFVTIAIKPLIVRINAMASDALRISNSV